MALTPADVHNVAFKMSSLGKRGYEQDEVDAFLDLVEDELARLIEENNELTARVAAFKSGAPSDQRPESPHEVADSPVVADSPAVAAPDVDYSPPVVAQPEPPATPAPAAVSTGEVNVRAARLLGLAQETADRLTSEATTEAQETLSSARAEAERVLSEATTESDRLRIDAREQSDALIHDAVSKADAAESEARAKAAALLLEAQTTRDETISGLATEKARLEEKIDGLRTYEREYRSRLKSWITEQLEGLEHTGGESSTQS